MSLISWYFGLLMCANLGKEKNDTLGWPWIYPANMCSQFNQILIWGFKFASNISWLSPIASWDAILIFPFLKKWVDQNITKTETSSLRGIWNQYYSVWLISNKNVSGITKINEVYIQKTISMKKYVVKLEIKTRLTCTHVFNPRGKFNIQFQKLLQSIL